MAFSLDGTVARGAAAGCGFLVAGALWAGCGSNGTSGSGAAGTVGGTSTGTGTGGAGSTTSTTGSMTTTSGSGGGSTTSGTGGAGGASTTSTGTSTSAGTGGSGGSPCDPAKCDDSDACTTDGCENGACAHTPVGVDDGDACTTDACDPATGVSHKALSCDDGNVCTADSCNPASGCVTAPIVYFLETFADNSQGWTLGTSWQIGPELASPTMPPAPLSNPDPTMDHTPTDDNGVAGVYIGGVTTQSSHAAYYLTSPSIDLGAVQTPVTLEFWRYLNSDDPSLMKSTVEVYDGSAWKQVYANGGQVKDAAWVKQQYDVSAYKSADFRMRWGWQVAQGGALICSQWNVDDVRLIPDAACP